MLAELGLSPVRFGSPVSNITQIADGTTARAQRIDGVQTLSPNSIIASDGTASVVRNVIAADFIGIRYPQLWLGANTEVGFSTRLKGLANVG